MGEIGEHPATGSFCTKDGAGSSLLKRKEKKREEKNEKKERKYMSEKNIEKKKKEREKGVRVS